ncbi:MAG TPA: hypothetical protein VL492_10260, partial [Methylovirgula sp.]|nr:hypothetical protein [Methylovirgula sp.]
VAARTGSEEVSIAEAAGCILAQSIVAPAAVPASAVALREGFAVTAGETVGATPYAPVYAFEMPQTLAIGDALPESTDAILPFSAVATERQPVEILATVSPGESVRRAGGDFAANAIIRGEGEKLRQSDVAHLQQAGITHVSVAVARAMIFVAKGEVEHAIANWLETIIPSAGASAKIVAFETDEELTALLARPATDLVAIVAETQLSARVLRSSGKLLAHGVAIDPGESMGCGCIEQDGRKVPVILMPHRPEAAFAAWLLLLRPCLDVCLGATDPRAEAIFPLSRKIVSAPGRADLVLLRRKAKGLNTMWEPLATGDLPWQALAQAEAWHLIGAGSEGMPQGEPLRAEYF